MPSLELPIALHPQRCFPSCGGSTRPNGPRTRADSTCRVLCKHYVCVRPRDVHPSPSLSLTCGLHDKTISNPNHPPLPSLGHITRLPPIPILPFDRVWVHSLKTHLSRRPDPDCSLVSIITSLDQLPEVLISFEYTTLILPDFNSPPPPSDTLHQPIC